MSVVLVVVKRFEQRQRRELGEHPLVNVGRKELGQCDVWKRLAAHHDAVNPLEHVLDDLASQREIQ